MQKSAKYRLVLATLVSLMSTFALADVSSGPIAGPTHPVSPVDPANGGGTLIVPCASTVLPNGSCFYCNGGRLCMAPAGCVHGTDAQCSGNSERTQIYFPALESKNN